MHVLTVYQQAVNYVGVLNLNECGAKVVQNSPCVLSKEIKCSSGLGLPDPWQDLRRSSARKSNTEGICQWGWVMRVVQG